MLSALASEKVQGEVDPQAGMLFTSYSVGASNILLNEITRKVLKNSNLLITGATADYYSNLGTLEGGLEMKMGRTPYENILLNDVQVLKESPYKPLQQDEIQKYIQVNRR